MSIYHTPTNGTDVWGGAGPYLHSSSYPGGTNIRCAAAPSIQERPWLYWKPSASGKVKDSPSAVAFEAPSPLQIWFLKVFLSISKNKMNSLKFGMPYLFWGGVLATPPWTLTEEERLRKHCAKVRLSKYFSLRFFGSNSHLWVKKKPATSLTVFPHMAMFGNFWQWERWYLEGVVGFSQWQNYNNNSCFYHTVNTGNVSYSAFYKHAFENLLDTDFKD